MAAVIYAVSFAAKHTQLQLEQNLKTNRNNFHIFTQPFKIHLEF